MISTRAFLFNSQYFSWVNYSICQCSVFHVMISLQCFRYFFQIFFIYDRRSDDLIHPVNG